MATEFSPADHLHRLVKEALDSGAATSLEEAEAMFGGFRLAFALGDADARDAGHQAALLTGIALARRVFLGGVFVSGTLDVPLAVPLPLGSTLREAAVALGAIIVDTVADTPLISIGRTPVAPSTSRFHIRTVHAGWRGGIIPAYLEASPRGGSTNPLASTLAAGLAVNEAFLFVRGGDRRAGRRAQGLSLWRPSPDVDWLADGDDEPDLRFLPTRLWIIGLGHLGQAYLWSLGLLTYPDPRALSLVLQDVDAITPSTESTSILSDKGLIGQCKTRAMAAWAERRGFATSIQERLFCADFRRQPDEPSVALCGMDNALGRRALDQVGFDFVVEAGLGRGYNDFRAVRLHTLPGNRAASEIWREGDGPGGDEISGRAAYQKMLSEGALDQCGVTLLAGKAVGAPFVGIVAASLVLSEVLRLLHGGLVHSVLDLDLTDLRHICAVPQGADLGGLNPGFVVAPQ